MTHWHAYISIDDKINDSTYQKRLSFEPLYTYNHLYHDIIRIVGSVSKNYIAFKITTYKKEPEIIDDWRKYVLNRDRIDVIVYQPNETFYTIFVKDQPIKTYTKLSIIYDDIDFEHVSETVIIYQTDLVGNKLKLIDVIDNPTTQYNNLITRMIHKYNVTF